ncbi:2-dehydro-3-deoxygalactonokinase [Azospirillum sp. YIM B02556]|uniref:2-dehydro-3-deoxygalactonokinase n=1 Tax=Azospirillum endophyticum TaxID=2800326 RepID=A0ABS1FHH9_9PROT|nr:2-dehydro-3-deoxygalactonokinase [Azospirillum endophyticum]MBK1842860.1 2-dehydro-3-deoxygalactonokinase [Azospirillum endophyticum]
MEAGRTRDTASLIALDWGTSSLRGFLMDGGGRVLDQRANAHGIQNLPQPGIPGFEQAFAELCGGWLAAHPGLPVVAGGMVGSAQGWAEAPYVPCPADTGTLASRAIAVDSASGVRILIAPGVTYDPPDSPPDILRGEEIQIAGVLADRPDWARDACMVLPGTHSKWVRIADGRMTRFATYMTGEVFAVLTRHSILGRLMPEAAEAGDDARDGAFAEGVRAAQASGPGDLTHQIFAARTLGITRRMAPELLKDYLSGLLIGHELVSGLAHGEIDPDAGRTDGCPLLLIGDGALCRRYVQGLGLLGVEPTARLENTAPRGLFQFAIAAGLIAPAGKDPHV